MKPLVIEPWELRERRNHFRELMEERGPVAAVLFNPTTIFYLVGFHFLPTERPMALFLRPSGETHLFVPRLEHEHAQKIADVDTVSSYAEYPGYVHPMEQLKEIVTEYGADKGALGIDSDGYGSAYGYQGPRLSDLLPNANLVSVGGIVENMRMCKSSRELDLIRESCRWGNLAHTLLQAYSRPGAKEIEIANRASSEATTAMIQTLGPIYRPASHGTAMAIFRGQIGANSALPHAVTINATLKPGDTLVTGAAADVYGYNSELERTMFVGEPSSEQRRLFAHMLQAQDLAMSLIKPGIPCSAVEEEMQRFYRESNLTSYTRHHSGHNVGLLMHEKPFLDVGDETVIQPGMLFTVEPGLYLEGLGGFRHSDTVVVTETGVEMLTYYPRDLESLICG